MNHGCVAIGEVTCDECGRTMHHPERYLVIEEGEKMLRYCTDCSLKKGFARQKAEKGGTEITFFPVMPSE